MKKNLLFLFVCFMVAWFGGVNASSIWEVSVDFCNSDNSTKSLSMVLDSGKEWEICMEFSNYSEWDVSISYGFVDGTVTADNYKSKACKNEWDIKNFWQYVNQDINEIDIPSMTKVRQKAYIKFPSWFTGMVNGCLTYFISDKSEKVNLDSAMFDVLVRKASFIDILVGWELYRNLKLAEGDPIKANYDRSKNSIILDVVFENKGNVNESVLVSWVVSSIFGYSVNFSGENVKVLSDENGVLKIETKNIPWYKWPFNISLDIVSNPDFNFNPDSLPDTIKTPITITANASIFILPWIFIYILWGLILLIIIVKFLMKHLKFQ